LEELLLVEMAAQPQVVQMVQLVTILLLVHCFMDTLAVVEQVVDKLRIQGVVVGAVQVVHLLEHHLLQVRRLLVVLHFLLVLH
jgi:hypothetical protein